MNCSWWWWVQIQVGSNVIQLIFKRQGPNWLVMLRFCMNNDQAEIFLPHKKRNLCFDCKHVWVGSNNGLRDAEPNYANTMPFGLPFLDYFRVCENHQILTEFDRHHCRSAVYFVGTQKSEKGFFVGTWAKFSTAWATLSVRFLRTNNWFSLLIHGKSYT